MRGAQQQPPPPPQRAHQPLTPSGVPVTADAGLRDARSLVHRLHDIVVRASGVQRPRHEHGHGHEPKHEHEHEHEHSGAVHDADDEERDARRSDDDDDDGGGGDAHACVDVDADGSERVRYTFADLWHNIVDAANCIAVRAEQV